MDDGGSAGGHGGPRSNFAGCSPRYGILRSKNISVGAPPSLRPLAWFTHLLLDRAKQPSERFARGDVETREGERGEERDLLGANVRM